MLGEICEQPEAAARTLDALLPRAAEIRRLAASCRRVRLVGRGSSGNAAVYGRYLVEQLGGLPASLAPSSLVTLYGVDTFAGDELVVCLSQSGATAEIVEVARAAQAAGAPVLAVTNASASPLAAAADLALVTRAGEERAVPATKTYLTALVALAVLAGSLAPAPPASFHRALLEVPEALAASLERDRDGAGGLAELAAPLPKLVVAGRGFTLTTAFELALKVQETCYRPALGLSQADLEHGPAAVLDEETLFLVVAAAAGPTVSGLAAVAGRARRHGVPVCALGGEARLFSSCRLHLGSGPPDERLAPLTLILPGQLFVERLAVRLGLDPDRPRDLTKVTQTSGTPRPDSGPPMA